MTRRQPSKSVESLTAGFVDRLFAAVERVIHARTRVLTAEWLDVALATHRDSELASVRHSIDTPRPPVGPKPFDDRRPQGTATTERTNHSRSVAPGRRRRLGDRPKRSRTAAGQPPTSALPSPEEHRRDAEFARLRALLKPTGQENASGAAETVSALAPAIVVAPPPDPLHTLEDEVRAQAHGLAQLPPDCCTARIAAWVGRVRSYEETNGNRVAAELLLDKLRALARAMDAGRIEALHGSWRATDWSSYIRTNETLAQARQQRDQRRPWSRFRIRTANLTIVTSGRSLLEARYRKSPRMQQGVHRTCSSPSIQPDITT